MATLATSACWPAHAEETAAFELKITLMVCVFIEPASSFHPVLRPPPESQCELLA